MKLQDKTAKIIYNTKAFDTEQDPELRALLNYFENSAVTSDFCNDLDSKVRNVRHSAQFRRDYTDMDLFAYDNRKEGEEKKMKEMIIELDKQGCSLELIANASKITVDEVKEILEKAAVAE